MQKEQNETRKKKEGKKRKKKEKTIPAEGYEGAEQGHIFP